MKKKRCYFIFFYTYFQYIYISMSMSNHVIKTHTLGENWSQVNGLSDSSAHLFTQSLHSFLFFFFFFVCEWVVPLHLIFRHEQLTFLSEIRIEIPTHIDVNLMSPTGSEMIQLSKVVVCPWIRCGIWIHWARSWFSWCISDGRNRCRWTHIAWKTLKKICSGSVLPVRVQTWF